MTGTYAPAFIFYAICIFLCLIIGLVMLRGKKTEKAKA